MPASALKSELSSQPGIEQLIFRLLAISWTPVDLSDLTKAVRDALPCLDKMGEITPPKITQAVLEPHLEDLVQSGSIERIKNREYQIPIGMADSLMRSTLLEKTFSDLVAVVCKRVRDRTQYSYSAEKPNDQKRCRIAFYSGELRSYLTHRPHDPVIRRRLRLLSPFDHVVYEALPPDIQNVFWRDFGCGLVHSDRGCSSAAIDQVGPWLGAQPADDAMAISIAADLFFAAGRWAPIGKIAEMFKNDRPEVFGLGCVLRGEIDEALKYFSMAMPEKSLGSKSSLLACQTLAGIFYPLLLIRQSDMNAAKIARGIINLRRKHLAPDLHDGCDILLGACAYLADPGRASEVQQKWIDDPSRPLATLVSGYVREACFDSDESPRKLNSLKKIADSYQTAGLCWFAAEAMMLSSSASPKGADPKSIRSIYSDTETKPMAGQFERIPIWKTQLSALQTFASSRQPRVKSAGREVIAQGERMAWLVNINAKSSRVDVRPLIQKAGKSGWSKGRPVALERIYDSQQRSKFDFLTPQDREICAALRCDSSRDRYGYTEYSYFFDESALIDSLIGHPDLLLDDNSRVPIEIVKEQARLVVERSPDGGATISMSPQPKSRETDVLVQCDSPSKFSVIRFSEDQMKLASMLKGALTVPSSAVDQLLEVVRPLAPIVSLHSEIEVSAEGVEEVTADPALHAHLTPYEEGLQVSFFTRPFGNGGGFFTPGRGSRTVVTSLEGRTRSTRRDLDQESLNVRELQKECEFLSEQDAIEVIDLPTSVEALEALMQLEKWVDQSRLTLHWPKGKSFEIAGTADESDWNVNIASNADWFAASGKLRVDENLAIEMMDLLNMAEASKSRFIQLTDGRFVALTEHFRRRLETIAMYTERRGGEARFPAIRSAAIAEMLDSAEIDADKQWQDQLTRIRSAGKVQPKVPKSLDADLRDYQVDGFKWLSRLAHLGAGACLADDMGLGKTLQCLGVLLSRSSGGPALVVAPTSVAANWVSEITKFAPTLNPIIFGEVDRDKVIASLGKRDVLICSYGLMAIESEKLQSRVWQTLVLDEAQAIKNADTKRSESAMGLQANFRVVLTGTPMENHLGELWNLFQFINPGLLGSADSFQQRFAIPIERDGRRDVGRQLRQLIQPFILRRTKSQVLAELPSRTEITVPIELGTKEAAMYEAIRKKALDNLANADDDRPAHIRILAELMRLRRFCCHPDLVDPESGLEAAKLDRFTETVEELIGGGHKVLVFSQFVGHLHILRERLDQRNISYQYLDGSTPAKTRKKSVDAFQDGQGDVFLISLRAGGVGLNLTAADYVIHMDPWWNPAVEDQASDRAHRMGQQRPVTVYRFITTGTVEERILQLHERKRDLADSLLEGTESAAKMTAEELMKLIQQ